eukprot:1150589-Pelagomonas_calceolata.AAC.7
MPLSSCPCRLNILQHQLHNTSCSGWPLVGTAAVLLTSGAFAGNLLGQASILRLFKLLGIRLCCPS